MVVRAAAGMDHVVSRATEGEAAHSIDEIERQRRIDIEGGCSEDHGFQAL